MYQPSTWFRYAYKYAESLRPIYIYILSAKYGLLRENDEIEPYEKTLSKAKEREIKKWSFMVYEQMKKEGIDFNQKAIFLCGKNYRKYLIKLFKNREEPVARLGIGKQVRFFIENTKTI